MDRCGRTRLPFVRSDHDCDEPITKLFAAWFETGELTDPSELLSSFAALYRAEPFLRAVDLLVITRPYVVGWMLRLVDPPRPMLHVALDRSSSTLPRA